jgi:TRAP-type C4-dicarboxylate transport system substrate-binding protein
MKYYIITNLVICIIAIVINLITFKSLKEDSQRVSTAIALVINTVLMMWGIMLLMK